MSLYKLFTSLSFSLFIWKMKYCLPLRMALKIRGVDMYQVAFPIIWWEESAQCMEVSLSGPAFSAP